ncbi:MAG: sensor histidine kinase [Haloferacaceae archaeon]
MEVLATPLLSSVCTNVLDNAVFHNDADRIRIEVGADVEDDVVQVRIADNGPGIPDAQKRAVFDQGEQGIDSTESGVGLFLVDQLVERFGGLARIEDNNPRVAIVCVELRRA